MDERVRFLQSGRMKLMRLIAQDKIQKFTKEDMPLFQ